jgi:hypothetical protein
MCFHPNASAWNVDFLCCLLVIVLQVFQQLFDLVKGKFPPYGVWFIKVVKKPSSLHQSHLYLKSKYLSRQEEPSLPSCPPIGIGFGDPKENKIMESPPSKAL